MLEDRWLLSRFSRGDGSALQRLYQKYKDDLVTLAAALLLDTSAAEDVVHDVFISFLSTAGRFRLTGSLKGFLMTCVANRARNCNKADRRRARLDVGQMPPRAGDAIQPEQAAIFGERFDQLGRALAQLPYEQRETLLLRSYGRMRLAAIAEAQGISINTVHARYRYAIEKLRALLDSEVNP